MQHVTPQSFRNIVAFRLVAFGCALLGIFLLLRLSWSYEATAGVSAVQWVSLMVGAAAGYLGAFVTFDDIALIVTSAFIGLVALRSIANTDAVILQTSETSDEQRAVLRSEFSRRHDRNDAIAFGAIFVLFAMLLGCKVYGLLELSDGGADAWGQVWRSITSMMFGIVAGFYATATLTLAAERVSYLLLPKQCRPSFQPLGQGRPTADELLDSMSPNNGRSSASVSK